MYQDEASRFASYPSLRDQIILITGGASGIGASFTAQFAAQGSRVIFLDIQTEAAEDLVDELRASSRHAPIFVRCDLTDLESLAKVVGKILGNVGSPKALVNNAGNDARHVTEEVTPDFWERCIALNLRHQFFMMQAVIPSMKACRSGSIINISSISPVIPSTGVPVYIAAKSGIIGLTRTLSKELGAWNIRVNAILPGAIETERQRKLWLTPEYKAEILANQSLKRMLQPEEVGRMALFLAADDSSAITGQQHVVDGGWV